MKRSAKYLALSACLYLSMISGATVVVFCGVMAAPMLFTSCGTTEVAKAQQVTHAAAVDFNAFVQFEKANRDALWNINHGIKHAADRLRHKECIDCKPNGQKYIETAISLVDAYKNNRTPENKANMDTAIAVIQELINQISDYFLDPQIRSIDPMTATKYQRAKVVP